MFLKRSLSEPAAPRPTRPRLQLTPEENIGNEPRESSLHDEEGNHAGYDFGQQTLPSSTPAEDSYSSSLFSSVSTGGEYRHHANSYPAPSLGPVRGRSTYRSSPHPYPLPSSGTIWASPRMQNSPNVVTASTSSSDSSSTMTLAVPSTSYSSLSSALPASGDYRDYDNDGSSRGSLIEERSMSGSPIRSQISSVPLSGPLQFPSTDTHSDEIQQRRRAWSIRSTLTPQHTLPRFFGYHRSAENINSNITDGSFSFAPDNALSNQRPVSRASLPPSRPGSPIGSEFQPGRRNVFPKQSHRRTSTWGEHWSYLRPPNHDSSPSPSPSASPHREPMSSSVGSAQTPLSWQQVETERRREFVTGFMMESQEEGDPATQITDKEKDVDLAQLMSTDKMGWEQRLPVWPIHQSVLSAEVAGTSTEIQSQAHDTISWTPASPGRTGYVTSIVDPHLYDSESYHQSSKPHQEHVNVPSSSYSTLSGWAGEELDNRIMDPSSPDTFYSSRPGVIGEPVMVFTTPSPLYRLAHLPETSLESQRKPLPEDAE
ncbi:hypothetical protein J3R30DRAFT_218267 [Lentinula aciculospora]|uniref:Uncharacterized protein n=1 Tax=Lentinula aciculospora TaxID=153920 RepID=A0A9W9A992_9AGAR|nr:hypothetical protein J3R30DRAFT_218267 [Lentinula aciculospora]